MQSAFGGFHIPTIVVAKRVGREGMIAIVHMTASSLRASKVPNINENEIDLTFSHGHQNGKDLFNISPFRIRIQDIKQKLSNQKELNVDSTG